MRQRRLHRFVQTRINVLANDNAINNSVDMMLFLGSQLRNIVEFTYETIYTNAHTVGGNKIEVRAYGVEKREHVYDGQDDVLAVHYIAKGCRRTDVTYNHVVIVANGHGLPDAPGMWGASSKAGNITTRSSRYRSGDPRWLDDLKLVVDGLEVVFERITGAWSAAQSAA